MPVATVDAKETGWWRVHNQNTPRVGSSLKKLLGCGVSTMVYFVCWMDRVFNKIHPTQFLICSFDIFEHVSNYTLMQSVNEWLRGRMTNAPLS